MDNRIGIDTMVLSDFIDCVVDKNYKSISWYKGDIDELIDRLLIEYADVSSDNFLNKGALSLLQSITRLSTKIYCSNQLILLYYQYKREDIKELLSSIIGVNDPLCIKEEDVIVSSSCLSRLKRLELELQEARFEYEQYNKKNEQGKSIDRKYFQELLIAISTDNGFLIKEKDITVYQFAKMLHDFSEKSTKKIYTK